MANIPQVLLSVNGAKQTCGSAVCRLLRSAKRTVLDFTSD